MTIATLLDFGVDMTGANDSTAEIQAAINGCEGVLIWQKGWQRIEGSVEFTAPCRIIGPGTDQWRVAGAAANVITSGVSNTLFRINANNVVIDGLNFPGTSARCVSGGGKAITVGDTPGATGDGTITGTVLSNVGISSHGMGVHFIRASDWLMERRCDIHSYNAVTVENLVHVDKGDSAIANCHFAADPIAGKCLTYKGSGGLRVLGNKFLTCQDSIYITWTNGLSGGPIIQGNSLENMTRRGIFIVGNPSSTMNGLAIQNNWINGAVDSIFVDSSAIVQRAIITGNNILGGPTSIGINLGALMTDFLVAANNIDGNGQTPSYGIFARNGAQGRVAPNYIHGFSTAVINQSAGVVVSAQWGCDA